MRRPNREVSRVSRRIVLSVLLAMVVLLLPGTLHARYLSANTGRFQTMDTYAGNNEDPTSLLKYLYGGDDPVNNSDPSGNDVVGDFDLGGFDLSSIDASPIGAIAYGVERLANTVAGHGHLSSKTFWSAYQQVNYPIDFRPISGCSGLFRPQWT